MLLLDLRGGRPVESLGCPGNLSFICCIIIIMPMPPMRAKNWEHIKQLASGNQQCHEQSLCEDTREATLASKSPVLLHSTQTLETRFNEILSFS